MDTKIVRKQAVIPATREQLWNDWTTEAGVTSFFARKAKIELTPGGAYECYFRTDAPPGLQGSEECKVITFWPMDYISFTWNAPPEFPEERREHTKVTVEFDRHDEQNYRVTLTHTGFGEGGKWDEVVSYFDEVWEYVLDNQRKKYLANETHQA